MNRRRLRAVRNLDAARPTDEFVTDLLCPVRLSHPGRSGLTSNS